MIPRCCLRRALGAGLAWWPLWLPAHVPAEQPTAASDAGASAADSVLVWDARTQHHDAEITENLWDVEFHVVNRSSEPCTIVAVQPSCGCTVPQMPADPWVLAPGGKGTLRLRVDFTGKEGTLAKDVLVISDAGQQRLHLTLTIPERIIAADPTRRANVAIARADRQAVFRGDCARCHVEPARGRTGAMLYATACGICHEAPHRASMVPLLADAKIPRDEAYWREIVHRGRPGTLMPAFAQAEGGPLDPAQCESLVVYLRTVFGATSAPP